MTALPDKELLRPDEVAKCFGIDIDDLPPVCDIIQKRERLFLEKVIKPWIEKMDMMWR